MAFTSGVTWEIHRQFSITPIPPPSAFSICGRALPLPCAPPFSKAAPEGGHKPNARFRTLQHAV
ncbi:hypothetical protein ACNKHT_23410 [Shigella flexneri]